MRSALILFAALAPVIAYGLPQTEQPAAKVPLPDKRVVTAHAAFGFDILRRLADHPGANVVFAPTSVSSVLELALNGAAGPTRDEIAKTLHLEGVPIETVNSSSAALRPPSGGADPRVKLYISNSVWVDQGFPVEKPFVDVALSSFGAKVTNVKMGTSAARVAINAEVSRQTNRMIREVAGSMNGRPLFTLVNAVYFDGKWTSPFSPDLTTMSDFHLLSGEVQSVPMMHADGGYRFVDADGTKCIRLPYGAGRYAMYVLLPRDNDGLSSLISSLDAVRFRALVDKLEIHKGNLSFPKFRSDATSALDSILQAMGIVRAFKLGDGFSGISRGSELCLGNVVQRAILEIDESGTRATAVTMGSGFGGLPPEPPPFEMVVDHPFLCAIRDDKTGEILFLGAIYDPTK